MDLELKRATFDDGRAGERGPGAWATEHATRQPSVPPGRSGGQGSHGGTLGRLAPEPSHLFQRRQHCHRMSPGSDTVVANVQVPHRLEPPPARQHIDDPGAQPFPQVEPGPILLVPRPRTGPATCRRLVPSPRTGQGGGSPKTSPGVEEGRRHWPSRAASASRGRDDGHRAAPRCLRAFRAAARNRSCTGSRNCHKPDSILS